MLEWADSFDSYTTAQLGRRYPGNIAGSITINTTGADGTGQYLKFNADSCALVVPVVARAEYFVGFDFRCNPNNGTFMTFMTAANVAICTLGCTVAGAVSSTFGNSANVIVANTWYQVQIYLKRHASAGILTVKIDGVVVINLTGLNTGATDIGLVALKVDGNGNGQVPSYDNFWVFNTLGSHSNGFPLGRIKVRTILPTADGTNTAWTPNSGTNHFDRVNQATSDDDTSYISGVTPGDKDSFAMANLTDPILQIHGVVLNVAHRKDDVDIKTLRTFVRSGATTTESADISVPLTYMSSTLVVPEDPNGAIQWTETTVNALEAGVNVIA